MGNNGGSAAGDKQSHFAYSSSTSGRIKGPLRDVLKTGVKMLLSVRDNVILGADTKLRGGEFSPGFQFQHRWPYFTTVPLISKLVQVPSFFAATQGRNACCIPGSLCRKGN
jgi:hypothetical protein